MRGVPFSSSMRMLRDMSSSSGTTRVATTSDGTTDTGRNNAATRRNSVAARSSVRPVRCDAVRLTLARA